MLGLWLTTLGVRVRIIDKTAEPGTTSRALAVQVRTLEFYRQVGIADALIAGGVNDLTADEKAAIKSGNAAKLHELGVDERVRKSILFDDERGRGDRP